MIRSMRIAIASIEYPPQPFSSGIGTYTKVVAEGLAARGHRVHVVTRGTDRNALERHGNLSVEYVVPGRAELPAQIDDSVRMAGFAARGLLGEARYRRRIARRLHQLVDEEGYELVEAADHMGEAAWFDPSRHPGVPFVVRLHTPMSYSERLERNVPSWVTAVVASLERRQVRHATHLTCPAAALVEPMLEVLRATGRQVTVYPNPRPPSLLRSAPVPDPQGPPAVLFVGRLTGWKGADTLMRAVPAVLRHHPRARFLLAGADSGPAHGFPSYQAFLSSLLPAGTEASVTFLGRVEHDVLADHYLRASVCVFPSRFEVQGYTCLEAMSFGKAIVGSAVGGMRELLDEGAAGLLHQPPDPADLADKILALLNDADLRRHLGERAFERARTRFSTERSLEAAEAFYARAIGGPLPRSAAGGRAQARAGEPSTTRGGRAAARGLAEEARQRE